MKSVKRLFFFLVVLAALAGVAYFMGPTPPSAVYDTQLPDVPADSTGLINYIKQNEAQHKLRPDNEARIVWANDSSKVPTEYALVYLHGFSASQEEGDPVHVNVAQKFGCNLYLARLAEHGIDTTEQLMNLTAQKYWNSVKEAYAIGKRLGKKVILMGTSTGGSNALHLAAAFPDVHAIILLSPNIEINNRDAWLLNNPWGLQIARFVTGSHYITPRDSRDIYKQYWNSPYRLEAVVNLQEYVESTMTPETFEKVTQPTLLLYYYRDEVHQDSIVKVSAMLRMFDELGTSSSQRLALPMPNTGDHVIGGYIKSNDYQGVEAEITKFMMNVLGMQLKN
jgi:esterase/lipase